MLLENCSPHVHSICPCITNDSVLGMALLVLLCHCMFLLFYLANFRVIMRICIHRYLYAMVCECCTLFIYVCLWCGFLDFCSCALLPGYILDGLPLYSGLVASVFTVVIGVLA